MTHPTTGTQARQDLSAIANDEGLLAIVAMDQRNTLKRMFAAVGIADPSVQELQEIGRAHV